MQKEYLSAAAEVLSDQGVDENLGLSNDEASSRLAKTGPNKLEEAEKTPLWKRFFEQMADPMVIMLIVAAVISALTGMVKGEADFADVAIIMFVVIVNSVLGVVQEAKSEEALEALQEMSAAQSKVLRDGKLVHLPSAELVPGDVIMLEAGDSVPADCRVLESATMKIEEAALTGESVPVEKHANVIELATGTDDVPLGDRKNMCYMGSTVVYGRGRAVVVGTGMDTEMGKIAGALAEAKEELTPLQVKLAELSRILTIMVIVICVVIFGVDIIRHGVGNVLTDPTALLDTFMVAVSLAVAAIPEGLVAVVTIVLSLGVTKMAKRQAIIRKLSAVETLGCTQTICSDKTGTLTQNKMTVVKHELAAPKEKFLAGMALCSDAQWDEELGEAVGEPTECALVNDAGKAGLTGLTAEHPRVGEAPFDSGRKMMSVVVETLDGEYEQYTKGAPDVVIGLCTHIYEGDKVVPLTEERRAELVAANKAMADEALRVLALASRTYTEVPADCSPAALEHDLVFCGLSGMIDPVRPEVADAIREAHDAGIRTVMITGDHIDTAVAIAKQLNIYRPGDKAIDGAGLDFLPQETLEEEIEAFSVYARVTPEHKMRIVQAWQRRGHVVAMTGDGVNDAPALKAADIGCAMGKTGTDVAKGAADMILTDDNFATVVAAVEQGRGIYANIRKAIHYLLSCNIGEILTIFLATLLPFSQAPLSPVQLLWLNLVTDSLPALALGMEPVEKTAMTQPPRGKEEPLFSQAFSRRLAWQGALVGGITLLAYGLGFHLTGTFAVANTMAFATLTFSQLFHAFDVRSETTPLFRLGVLSNKAMNKAFLAGAALQAAVLLAPPLQGAFSVVPLALEQWGMVLALALTPLVVCEAAKLLRPKGRKKSQAEAARGVRETVGTR